MLNASLVGAEFERHLCEIYMYLGRAYELGGQPEHAKAASEELWRLAPKLSRQDD